MSDRQTVLPDLIDALVALGIARFAEATVTDGPVDMGNLGAYLCIGCDDPFSESARPAATSTIEWVTNNGREESGYVACAIYAWDGSGVMKTARDECLSMASVIQADLKARTVTLDGAHWRDLNFADAQYGQDRLNGAALAVLSFHINYRARI